MWLNLSAPDPTSPGLPERFFAVGEEKTNMKLPPGYGYAYKTTDRWLLNYMLHNLTPDRAKVWVTYDIDFIPATSPAAKGIQAGAPDLDGRAERRDLSRVRHPRGGGHDGEFTYPDDATDPYKGGPAKNVWTVEPDGVLLATAGHVHPGGLRDDLWLQRTGAVVPTDRAKPGTTDTVHLFSSVSHYYEPAGPVSWDVTMSATPDDWRVQVHKGDKLSVTATYDSKLGDVVRGHGNHGRVDGRRARKGTDPFTKNVSVPGVLTHGHLPENDNHGGPTPDPEHYVDVTKLPSKMLPNGYVIPISNFVYARGDMSIATSVPTIKAGQSLTFKNLDSPLGNGIWHTITACRRRATARPASRSRSPTRRSCSTPASSGSPTSRHRVPTRGRHPPTCRPAPTRTSAGSTRSCEVRSASSPTDQVRRALKWLFAALVVVVLLAGGFVGWYIFGSRVPGKPKLHGTANTRGGPRTPVGTWHVVRGKNVYVGYRIKELFGDALLKRDAVGQAHAVNGTLTIAADRVTAAAVSADVNELGSDRSARDSYVRDTTLETSKFPTRASRSPSRSRCRLELRRARC